MMEKSKILIIMRNKIVMDKYAKTLRNSGFSVFTNSNPAAFLDLCKSLEPEIILWGDVLTKKNKELIRDATNATHIDRLNIGAIPTTKLNWLQPHEGNIIDFLFRSRAYQFADAAVLAGA